MAKHSGKMRFSRRGMLIFCACGLVFSLLMLLRAFEVDFSSLIPSPGRITELREQVEKARSEYEKVAVQYQQMSDTRNAYTAETRRYWNESEDGDPEIEVRVLVEEAARKQELKISNIGQVRRSRVNAEVYSIEVDIVFQAELEKISGLLLEFSRLEPVIFIKRLEIRSDARQGQGLLNFNATLRMLGREV